MADISQALRLAHTINPGTPTPGPGTDGLDTTELMSLFQAAVVEMHDRFAFIANMSLTALQTAVPDDARRRMIHEISAACRGELPLWWDAFKKEHNLGGYRG